MKRQNIFAMIVLSLLMLSLSSCYEQTELPCTEATQADAFDIHDVVFHKTSVVLAEAEDSLGSSYSLKKDMEMTQRSGVTYAFESKISPEDRAACIQTTETILEKIGAEKNIQIYIYTTGAYHDTFIKENAVYTYLQDWNEPEYISALLYGLFGEYCNYGMIFGYANYLCKELYNVPMDVCEAGWTYQGNLNALDLNLLCFRSEFTAEEDIRNIELIANTFVVDYISANGAEAFHRLLEISADAQQASDFADVLAGFYGSWNIDYMPTDVLYRLGGKSYDYIVKCKYAVMYIEPDWSDANMDLCPYTYEGFLHQNYADIRQFFAINAEQMGEYQELFSLNSYDNDLNIYFSNTAAKASTYMPLIHAICVRNTGSITHEYIHALTMDSIIQEAWAIEGFARYFSYFHDYYGNAMSNVDYNSVEDTARYHYIHEYKNSVGRDIDVSKDYAQLQHIAAYVYGYDDPNDGDGYTAGASFIGYLISRFGEEKVIQSICRTHDFGEYTYSQLVADWQVFLEENYSAYGTGE